MDGTTTRKLQKMKGNNESIVMITAYDYPTGKIVDRSGVDVVLVGDSLGMVVLGYESTIFVTMEDMLHHTKAVSRGVKNAMVISDVPFAVSSFSRDHLLKEAVRLMQEGGAYGVKMEGSDYIEKIHLLTRSGIPVMGHLGLLPQSVNRLGGYFIQGKEKHAAQLLLEDAKRLEDSGVFALVLECIPEELAKMVSEKLSIPVIGIGAGRYCDGQVLVFHDILKIGGDGYPSFVKSYASIGDEMIQGVTAYINDVRKRAFPTSDHVSHLSEEMVQFLEEKYNEDNKRHRLFKEGIEKVRK